MPAVSVQHRRGGNHRTRAITGGEIMARDPVCNMQVNEQNAPKSDYKGRTYYFCSLDCKEQFDNNPQRYIKAA
jgi:YHS domain-containing protein